MATMKGGYGSPVDSALGDGTGLKGGPSPTSMENFVPIKPDKSGNDGGGSRSSGGNWSGTSSTIPEGGPK